MQLEIARPDDVTALAALHCRVALEAYFYIFPPDAPKPTPELLEPGWHRVIEVGGTTMLVYRAPDLVGCVAIGASVDVPTGWVLSRLYVDQRQWSEGVGSALHDAALAVARRDGARGVNLWVLEGNERGRGFYERRGWSLVPGRNLVNDTPEILDVLYERTLDAETRC